MDSSSRKRGRPKLCVTKEVLEEHRTQKRLQNAARRGQGQPPGHLRLQFLKGQQPGHLRLQFFKVLRRTCEATIVAVMEGEGWYYNCCPRCARKVQTTEGKYYCTFCSKEAGDFKPRFRLTVRVEDSTAQTTFTLFNKEAEQIVGIPVDKIIDELPEGTNIAEIPPVIRNIIGKRCVFDVKINEYNTVCGYEDYTVFRLKLSHQTEQASTSNKDNTDNSKKQRVN
ncbi:hypothetical protein DCAR_0100285 [Daucus carota subsp. sativus]|uniref:Replication factor A C-terminal domain-containing protein n=1 Tax=Daucus carota subsp. sativus TaxID=79200 RepID=A0AAF0VZR0_DAUCS|nr:hypothetical protein DCAR_0100285 [Daucus carota subsp. sativus]